MPFSAKIQHIKKIKNAKWLLPGWVFYEFYKLHKNKGDERKISFRQGAKAEVIRLAAFASLPIPGTYELTTTGLALLKNRIEKGEIEKLTLKGFRDFRPIKRMKLRENKVYLKVMKKGKEFYLKIFYRK